MFQHVFPDSSEFFRWTRCRPELSFALAGMIALLILTSCAGTPAAGLIIDPTATAAVVLTATPPPPSPTPTASITPAPTATAQPASPTPSLIPSPVPPTATVTRVPQVRMVRERLPNGLACPIREAPAPENALLIGRSAVCRLPIAGYRLGQGEIALVLVGGIHGGYEWNTVRLADSMAEYLRENPQAIPPSLSLYLIPNANPDGLYAVTGSTSQVEPPDFADTRPGRFNGREVDLNRNWDCEWAAEAYWGRNLVSGGAAPFSESETAALRDFFLEIKPAAVLFWHSAAAGVYPSGCGYLDPDSVVLADVYREAAGYQANGGGGFDNYVISGDAGNWLATAGIPAITVELSTHSTMDWEENLAGLGALLDHIASE